MQKDLKEVGVGRCIEHIFNLEDVVIGWFLSSIIICRVGEGYILYHMGTDFVEEF